MLIGAVDNHHALYHGGLFVIIESDVLLLKVFNSSLDDINSSVDDKVTCFDLGVGCLDLQESSGHSSIVSNLHDGHAMDLDPCNVYPLLEKLLHVLANERRVGMKGRFIFIIRSVGELTADTSEDFGSLVFEELVTILR